jgi:hypothetical protein
MGITVAADRAIANLIARYAELTDRGTSPASAS